MKNIIICADGTGNTTIKGRGTNVFKLYEAVDQGGHRVDPTLIPQVAIYHDGVGTESVKWLRALTGATGWGLSRNVKQLYGELARVYAPGDKIFLFGFSRGAFTVRTLSGLIHACGIINVLNYATNDAFHDAIKAAYAEYRQKYNSWLTRLFHRTQQVDANRSAELRQRFSAAVPEFEDEEAHGKLIEFMGVWDTVDAVGLPIEAADFVNRVIYAFKFPDRTLNASVAHACHALALDEAREAFKPVLWNESETTDPQRIEQVWFAGVHSNVGGGYPRQGMSLVALDWIMTKAEGHHLRFIAAERENYRCHADVDDKMYDSRAGVGVFYRWLPRDVQEICRLNGVAPKMHRSVFERIARNTEGYAPGSIPPDPEVISMSQPAAVTNAIRMLVRQHHGGSGPLVEREALTQKVGRWSYRIFIYGVLLTVFFMVRGFIESASTAGTETAWQTARRVGSEMFSSKWIALALETWWNHPSVLLVLGLALVLALWVDHRLDLKYSQFWHSNNMRRKLRKALGLG